MKQLTLQLVCLFFAAGLQAAPGPQPESTAATKTVALAKNLNTGAVRFQFLNAGKTAHKDSVLIIFDRYDHTGAGVIYKVFAQNDDNSIDVSDVPAGKYYVSIQCLGVHRDRLEKTVVIRSKKRQNMKIGLTELEEFSKDKVVIPAYHPDFASMTILKSR